MATSGLGGVVLVGGRSRRMGRDKAGLSLGGIPLWRRQLGVLERAGARPVLLALRPRQRSFGERGREIRDRQADAGPLGGLHAALSALPSAQWVAVLAVDMPHIDGAWFRWLRALCRPGVGAVVVEPEGYQPLAAIYPASALAVVARRLRGRRLALQGLVAELVRRGQLIALPAPAGERWRAANWNEPADIPLQPQQPRTKRSKL
jgi:molybdopterin-guanine dinucleotide biosynthesis protein A